MPKRLRIPSAGGGWQAIRYSLRKAREVGGLGRLYKALRSKNACKTCALGMGGQSGGMVNEAGRFPEVCKKSIQAMAADMQGAIPDVFWSRFGLNELRAMSPRQLESCGRLVTPVRLAVGQLHYQPITWDEAHERIAGRLAHLAPDETFWYSSGRGSNEAAFVMQLLARMYGTNNVNNCSYYCHQASGVGLNSALGTGTATLTLEDLEHADCVLLIGANPASNHPRLLTTLIKLRRRKAEVIVVNPVVEAGLQRFRLPSDPWSLLFGTRIATQYMQPHVGGDLALLAGLSKRIVELEAEDRGFLEAHCEGWPEYEAWLHNLAWDGIVDSAGVDFETIDQAARCYAASQRAVIAWTMGITHHVHGVENVQAITNLALLRGMVGKPHAGLLPIRGHSNVQGIGSVGVTPKLKDAIFTRLQDNYGLKLPTQPGLDTLAALEAAAEGRLRFGFCLGGNLFGASPDASFSGRALQQLDQIVYVSTTLNTGHAHGTAVETIILPAAARDEESQSTTQESMFNFVRLSDGGPRRLRGPRSEVEIVARIARDVLGDASPVNWRALAEHREIRQMIATVVPGYEELAAIDETRKEFTIAGRALQEPVFPTPSGRARMFVHGLPPGPSPEGTLRLATVRSEGQFNTVVYEDEDIYRGQERRDVILVHPDDIARRGLRTDNRVTVRSACGEMPGVLLRAFDRVRPGNCLMYFPEANILVPRTVDPQSRTPAFKHVEVTLEPLEVDATRAAIVDLVLPEAEGSSRDSMQAC